MLFRFCAYGFLKNQRYFEPFLMLIFLQQGLSYFEIGLLIACRSLTINVLEIPSGVVADAWGRRRCMIVSFVAYIVSFLVFGFAASPRWYFPAMMLFGIGESFRTGTHKAMIFEWLRLRGREDQRTRVYGLTRSWSKYGSAVSSVLASLFVMLTGDYRSIFLLATVPCVINVANFLTYPPELDGEHAKATSLGEIWGRFVEAVGVVWRGATVRSLMAESMAWDGLFQAVKDYLQPVLALVAAGSLVQLVARQDWGINATHEQLTAFLVGTVYTVLFLLSGTASRYSYRLVKWFGDDQHASRWLWGVQLLTFVAFTVADCLDWFVLVAITFVVLHITQNLWRPILIGRFDEWRTARAGRDGHVDGKPGPTIGDVSGCTECGVRDRLGFESGSAGRLLADRRDRNPVFQPDPVVRCTSRLLTPPAAT